MGAPGGAATRAGRREGRRVFALVMHGDAAPRANVLDEDAKGATPTNAACRFMM